MISFPASPALNDTYTVGQTTWKWTGTAWQIIARPVAAHKSTHAIGGSDALTPADIAALPDAIVVSGAGTASANGTYTRGADLNGYKAWYKGTGDRIYVDGSLAANLIGWQLKLGSQPSASYSSPTVSSGLFDSNGIPYFTDVGAFGSAPVPSVRATHGHAISDTTGLQTALDSKIPSTEKGAANGVATLDSAGKVPSTQLPSYVDDVIEAANFASLPATGETGKIYVTIDDRKTYRWSGTVYVEISAAPGSTDAVPEGSVNLYYTDSRASAAAPVQSVAGRTGAVTITSTDLADFSTAASAAAPVQSVAGRTGAVTLAKSDVGLGNVDNTSDADKPVSTATQNALDGKQIKTVYSDTAPSHSPGLEWVDTTELRSYRSYGSLWVEIDRA